MTRDLEAARILTDQGIGVEVSYDLSDDARQPSRESRDVFGSDLLQNLDFVLMLGWRWCPRSLRRCHRSQARE